ncbi:TetR/AcrR family transcriptional regulator [Herbiconiux daphne]|uniref:TetR/AcrR family transcriptional regulator n=1 Tax=Herbiconiux daphne TaxID=2970914 RepID=A0ABT2H5R7_9MICO|nr:TetR/AcrR family transcriptional regulator [Herbiconiux daphne]MCS5735233.1 TetR/AcrR family transcriptional regulator [Herbiconiux daphne]
MNEHRANEHRNGPVRSAAARDAILEATARLFQSEGYDHLTIEGIAKEAGVGKQTIYRWWPTRGALIADCLSDGRLFAVDFAVPDTGDLVADVEQWLDTVIPILDAPGGGALLRSLVAAAAEDSAVGDHLSESLGVERHLSERLTAGIRDGQLAPGAPVDELGHAILGTIIVQVLSRQDDATDRLRQLVRFMLRSGSPQNGPLSPTDAK